MQNLFRILLVSQISALNVFGVELPAVSLRGGRLFDTFSRQVACSLCQTLAQPLGSVFYSFEPAFEYI